MKGTPKSLKDAVRNGFEAASNETVTADVARIVHAHAQDFLANVINPLLLSADPAVVAAAEKLWGAIQGINQKEKK